MHYLNKNIIENIGEVSISVIGIGGTGSQLLSYLGKIDATLKKLGRGQIRLTACDGDLVDDPNIGRQNFSFSDIGKNKAEVVINRINRFYNTHWEYYDMNMDPDTKPNGNIIITCTDNKRSRKWVKKIVEKKSSKLASTLNIPYYWIDIGNDQDRGQIIMGTTKNHTEDHLDTLTDFFPNALKGPEKKTVPSCSTYESIEKQDLFINTILAVYASKMLWELLYNMQINYNAIFVNLSNMAVTTNKL